MVRAAILLLTFVVAAPSVAQARARRAPKPRLMLKVTVVSTPPAVGVARTVERALHAAIDAAPRAIRKWAFDGKGSATRIARELRRRGLRHYGLTGTLSGVSHRVAKGASGKTLQAEATVTLRCTVLDRKRKTTFEVKARGTSSTPISVVLQGEVLASRMAAARKAAQQALTAVLARLLPKKKRRRR